MQARDDPQYEIKSDKTDHIALHKAHAFKASSADHRCRFESVGAGMSFPFFHHWTLDSLDQ